MESWGIIGFLVEGSYALSSIAVEEYWKSWKYSDEERWISEKKSNDMISKPCMVRFLRESTMRSDQRNSVAERNGADRQAIDGLACKTMCSCEFDMWREVA